VNILSASDALSSLNGAYNTRTPTSRQLPIPTQNSPNLFLINHHFYYTYAAFSTQYRIRQTALKRLASVLRNGGDLTPSRFDERTKP